MSILQSKKEKNKFNVNKINANENNFSSALVLGKRIEDNKVK